MTFKKLPYLYHHGDTSISVPFEKLNSKTN